MRTMRILLLSFPMMFVYIYPSCGSFERSFRRSFEDSFDQYNNSAYDDGRYYGGGCISPPRHMRSQRQNGCTSDYGCGYGEACVKGELESHGFCAKKVDAYGVPTMEPPREDSIGVAGSGECSFDTECPIRFRCMKRRGELTGHCIK